MYALTEEGIPFSLTSHKEMKLRGQCPGPLVCPSGIPAANRLGPLLLAPCRQCRQRQGRGLHGPRRLGLNHLHLHEGVRDRVPRRVGGGGGGGGSVRARARVRRAAARASAARGGAGGGTGRGRGGEARAVGGRGGGDARREEAWSATRPASAQRALCGPLPHTESIRSRATRVSPCFWPSVFKNRTYASCAKARSASSMCERVRGGDACLGPGSLRPACRLGSLRPGRPRAGGPHSTQHCHLPGSGRTPGRLSPRDGGGRGLAPSACRVCACAPGPAPAAGQRSPLPSAAR
jgi:hypothetical protein